MAYVNVPKDLSRIKNKAVLNLTFRQIICFGSAAAVGIPVYIFSRTAIGGTAAALLMIGLMLPMFFLAMYEKDGQPAEKVLRNIIRTKIYFPGKRPYRSENLYENLEKEGKRLAGKSTAKKQANVEKRRKQKAYKACKG